MHIWIEAEELRAGQRSVSASSVCILCEIRLLLCVEGADFGGAEESWLSDEKLSWFMQHVFVVAIFASNGAGCLAQHSLQRLNSHWRI